MDDDDYGDYRNDDLIETNSEKEANVKERIMQLEEDIKVHLKSREQLITKLKEQRIKERLNASGIDEDAILSVRIVEARELKPIGGKADPYCVLRFGGQQQKTNYQKQDLNPVWNEVFTFEVETGKEILEVIIYDRDDFARTDDFEGRFEVNMD